LEVGDWRLEIGDWRLEIGEEWRLEIGNSRPSLTPIAVNLRLRVAQSLTLSYREGTPTERIIK